MWCKKSRKGWVCRVAGVVEGSLRHGVGLEGSAGARVARLRMESGVRKAAMRCSIEVGRFVPPHFLLSLFLPPLTEVIRSGCRLARAPARRRRLPKLPHPTATTCRTRNVSRNVVANAGSIVVSCSRGRGGRRLRRIPYVPGLLILAGSYSTASTRANSPEQEESEERRESKWGRSKKQSQRQKPKEQARGVQCDASGRLDRGENRARLR